MRLNTLPSSFTRLRADRWTIPFWEAGGRGELVVAKCGACSTYRMPPSPFCPACRTQEIVWEESAGRGTLYSYTITYQALVPGLAESVPYAPAVVRLDDAPVLLPGLLVEMDSDDIRIGMPLQTVWNPVEGGATPHFRPAG